MRLRMVTGTALAAASMVLLWACSTQPTETVDGLHIETHLSATELRPGDSVVVRVVVTNTSTSPRTIPWYACPSVFVVVDAAGDSVAPEGHDRVLCTADARARTLAPGEQAELTGVWRGEMRDGGWVFARPGMYRVFGRLLVTRLISAPVTLEVFAR